MLETLLLSRLRAETFLGRLSGAPRKPRVLATACWHFPVYSQTFVYREVLALATNRFDVRFAYAEQAPREFLTDECGVLWKLKRRIVLADAAASRDMQHYIKRMPEKVRALCSTISAASGLSEAQVMEHPHFRFAFSFTRMAEAWRADYIHTYFFYEAAVFGLVASVLLDIPRGVSCYADHMLGDYELKMVSLHMQTSAVIVATSARIKRELEALSQCELPAAIVKPNGIDASRFPNNERPPSSPERIYRIVAVSRIHPKKGLATLMEAARILRDGGMRFVLDILGEPDTHDPHTFTYFDELKQFVAQHSLDKTVRFQGRQNALEVRQYLVDADIFVAPFVELANGDKDGIPTALLEAMAAGCAIVGTDAGSITEVITDGVEGHVVPQFDATALASALRDLADNDPLRARMAKAAVDRVLQAFDVSHCETIFHERVRAAIDANRNAKAQVRS